MHAAAEEASAGRLATEEVPELMATSVRSAFVAPHPR